MIHLLTALLLASQSGPLLHWKGDDGGSPTTALDSSGNGFNGTYINGCTTSTTVAPLQFPNSGSMVFDGLDDRIETAGFSWPTGGPITVTFWSHVTAAQVTTSSLFTIGNVDFPSRVQAHVPWVDEVLCFDYGSLGPGRVIAWYDTYLDKWTHLALVSEGNGGAFKGIYADGVLVGSHTVSDGPDVPLTGCILGNWQGNFHRGLVDDFRIYNRVLSPLQVRQLAAGFTEPAAPTGLTTTGLPGAAQLSWTAATGAASYNVKRAEAAGGPQVTIASATGTTYSDTTVTGGTTYYYVVTSVGVNESAASNESSVVPLAAPPAASQVQNITVKGCGGLGLDAIVLLALFRAARRRRSRESA